MTDTDKMDADLAKYTDFQRLSDRVGYWNRRFALTHHTDEEAERFDAIVAKHSNRVLGVLRAG